MFLKIQMMRLGGNNKCIQFLKQHGVSKETPIPQKYNSPAALLYRDRMSAEVEGRPLPTELPAVQPGGAHGADQSTEPLAGESEAQYVARQRKLQEEVESFAGEFLFINLMI
jgi:ADP-ribosylation factor GTPase-activating protein 1